MVEVSWTFGPVIRIHSGGIRSQATISNISNQTHDQRHLHSSPKMKHVDNESWE
jgi:hypothetical protein